MGFELKSRWQKLFPPQHLHPRYGAADPLLPGFGFHQGEDFTLDDPSVRDALGLKVKKLRGVFMRLGDDPDSPVLDLVHFIDPPPQGQPYPTANFLAIRGRGTRELPDRR
jgi:hypothetical protein